MTEGDRRATLSPGAEFAGYRIERRLGRGGMGIVYEATEPGLDRRVALKLIAPEAAADDVFRQRFAHESRIAAQVEHPNVVPIYAAGEEDGIPYIAMRLVAGSDLGRRILEAGRLEPARAVSVVAQVAGGLDALHAAGLIHRDVKPPNVLLSGAPGAEHAYLTDFGVARNVESEGGLTKTGRFVGTLDYVAPEQIRGGEIDARVDVYALGGMLFKSLTGEVPFPREGEAAKLYAHLNDDPPAPSLFTPLVPAALDRVIVRAMAKDPGERQPSAGDFGRAAQAALTGGQVAEPERTVATGAARGALTERVEPGSTEVLDQESEPQTTEAEPPAPPRADPAPAAPPREAKGRRSVVAAVLGIGVVLAGAALGIALLGGEDDDSLSREQLITQADGICADSQSEFTAAREEFPQGDTDQEQAVPFAEELVEISNRQVSRLEALDPPEEVAGPYEEYLELRRDVNRYDENALDAARQGNLAEVQDWRQANTDEAPERTAVAEEIGFEVCSANPNPSG